ELPQYHWVQPHIHLRRVAQFLRRAAELGGELLASGQAAVESEELHQVDDRDPPVELLFAGRGEALELGDHIDDSDRHRAWCPGRRGCRGGRGATRRGSLRRGGLRWGSTESELFHDSSENGHRGSFRYATLRVGCAIR